MLQFILKNLVVLISMIVASLAFGVLSNALIPWIWLTNFFIIIRHLIGLFDFIWDTTTMIKLVGYSLSIEAAFWTIRGILFVIKGSGFQN